MDCVVVVVMGLLVGFLMVVVMMMVMIRVKAGGGRIVELDCEGVILIGWLVGWLMREEDGICLCTTGRTDGREDGMGWDMVFLL